MPPPLQSAQPTRYIFDPYNSASTGHQRAENTIAGSTAWRDNRTRKLGQQFGSEGGGARLGDEVGTLTFAGKKDAERRAARVGRDVEVQAEEREGREKGQLSLRECLGGHISKAAPPPPRMIEKGLFTGLTFYINGSTYPLISDHKLKSLIVTHGGRIAIALGRRSVTHVILGERNTGAGSGAGGGLAQRKIAKEVQRVGGKGVRYVGVEWVLESIREKKRVAESRFECMRLAMGGQRSVGEMIGR